MLILQECNLMGQEIPKMEKKIQNKWYQGEFGSKLWDFSEPKIPEKFIEKSRCDCEKKKRCQFPQNRKHEAHKNTHTQICLCSPFLLFSIAQTCWYGGDRTLANQGERNDKDLGHVLLPRVCCTPLGFAQEQ